MLLEPGIIQLQLGKSLCSLKLYIDILLLTAVLGRPENLNVTVDIADRLTQDDQFLGDVELADVLLG